MSHKWVEGCYLIFICPRDDFAHAIIVYMRYKFWALGSINDRRDIKCILTEGGRLEAPVKFTDFTRFLTSGCGDKNGEIVYIDFG